MEVKTICLNCGTVLTDNGGRWFGACFDSSLPGRPSTDSITYARCGECSAVGLSEQKTKQETRLRLEREEAVIRGGGDRPAHPEK